MRRFRYTMFVDESGNPHVSQRSLDVEPYLGVTGCIFQAVHYRRLQAAFLEMKREFFSEYPPEQIDFQRATIMNKRGVFAKLQDASLCRRFDEALLRMFSRIRYRVVTIVIDKKSHMEKYGRTAKPPYNYCIEALLERYCLYLANQRHAEGDVVAEARGPDEDKALGTVWSSFYDCGTDHASRELVQRCLTSKEIKFKPKKAMVDGLQLVDMIANPSRSELLIDNGIRKPNPNLFCDALIRILAEKYDCRWCGRVAGYGKVFLPNKNTAL